MAITKRVHVILAASGREEELVLEPGTTTRDVLTHLNLDPNKYVLTAGRGIEPLKADADLYATCPNDVQLWAASPAEVGV